MSQFIAAKNKKNLLNTNPFYFLSLHNIHMNNLHDFNLTNKQTNKQHKTYLYINKYIKKKL